MKFKDLGLLEPILDALENLGYHTPTPIQAQSIPILLEGRDLLGCAQTGTGKTAAFAIPILQQLYEDENRGKGQRKIKALVVTPTRELAIQIADSFSDYGKHTGLKNTVIFGGVKQGSQTDALRRGVDVLVATPGRLLDLINQGYISLSNIEYFVLDEADQMLDMGFVHDIKRLIALLPKQRQSLFFSATMPSAIMDLSKSILGNPYRVTIKPEQATAERVEQAVYFVGKKSKVKLLIHLIETENIASVLVFSRTKHGADKIVRSLLKANIKAEAIHGNKSQGARQRALGNFKDGKIKVLIATDIAARGIDVEDLSHVVNYDLPNIPETYVHRIGRTGRASASGMAISFCAMDERPYLRDIQKLIGLTIDVVDDQPFVDDGSEPETPVKPNQNRGANDQRGRSRRPQSNNRGGHGSNSGGSKSNDSSNSNNSQSRSGSSRPKRRY
ncbi:MAG: ATP-dependent RNA helicase RhlE [Bacteroidia bacterium]